MRWHLLILPAAALLAGAMALPRTDLTPNRHESPARRLEVARLRAHFDSVDAELRGARMQLTRAQHTSRVTLIGWLREYRDTGRFPRNDRFPDRAMPFFRDSQGTLCAMAYLIDRSGRGDIVDRIALMRNNAFIPELADDRDLLAWLDSVGLSVAEAARIQPGYGPIVDGDRVSDEYAIGSILVTGTSLATAGLNFISPSKATGWAGLIAGGAAVIAGVANLDGNDATQNVAAANLLIGGGAMMIGLYRVLNPPGRKVAGLSQPSTEVGPRVAFEPQMIPASGGTRLGLGVRANF